MNYTRDIDILTVLAPCCGKELEVSRHLPTAFNTYCSHCGAKITASKYGVRAGHQVGKPPSVRWICEWCTPSPIPEQHPGWCTVQWCEKHQAQTWHWPKTE